VEFALEKAEKKMFIASIIGAFAGIIFAVRINPQSNYFIFLIVFAMIGVGTALLVIVAVFKFYEWVTQ
jgi:hypothetical protein